MASFKSKVAQLKATLCQQTSNPPRSCHETIVLKECKGTNRQELSLQQPIIIQRKTGVRQENRVKCTQKKTISHTQTLTQSVKKVEPWVPVSIPPRQRKLSVENIPQPVVCNKEIDIQIENDDRNKDCIKKLFKKIKKLEQDLKESQKENIRLKLELQNYQGRSRTCAEHQRIIGSLEKDKYRLQVDIEFLRKTLNQRELEIGRLQARVPKEIIKEVIVEKPVEVIVHVPKQVPGPERIVQKIVEVPKYIQVEKKVPVEVIKEVEKQVIRTVEIPVPTIVEKPVYIEKPIYIDRPVEVEKIVEVPIEVPVEYPVYIDKPVVQEEFLIRMRQLEVDLEASMRQKMMLGDENGQLRIKVGQLSENLEMLRRHNQEKNREVEILLQNSIDYKPFSPHHHLCQDLSVGSVNYSISSNPHHRYF